MAARKKARAEDANTFASAQSGNEEECRFACAKLRESCMRLYGVTRSTFDGAMAGHGDGMYTISEVGQLIEKWQKEEVK